MANDALLALGILSAPNFISRRAAIRATWMRWPNVGEGQPIHALFVVRSLHAPTDLERSLSREQTAYGDMLRVPVPHNATRVQGPVLSLVAWLQHAVQHFPQVRLIAKCDDDAYIQAPDLEILLRNMLARTHQAYIYAGKLAWFHWHVAEFEHAGFGWHFSMASTTGRACRSTTERSRACVGPFPFATGFLMVLSIPLARELSHSHLIRQDAAALRRGGITKPDGRLQPQVMEDVWLGSLIFRSLIRRDVVYVTLGEMKDKSLVSDEWGLQPSHSALLVHIRSKRLDRMLALHEFASSKLHCQLKVTLECARGCKAFLTGAEYERARLALWRGRSIAGRIARVLPGLRSDESSNASLERRRLDQELALFCRGQEGNQMSLQGGGALGRSRYCRHSWSRTNRRVCCNQQGSCIAKPTTLVGGLVKLSGSEAIAGRVRQVEAAFAM